MASDSAAVTVDLTRAQALAAGAVLRGYVAHQRERLGDQADSNRHLRNVQGALAAFEAQIGPLTEQEPRQRPTRRD